jgi:L-cysteine desulfidase
LTCRFAHRRTNVKGALSSYLAQEWSNELKQEFIEYMGCTEPEFLAWKNAPAHNKIEKLETV